MTLLEEAESLILHQFARSPKLKGLIRCVVKPFQDVLGNIEQLHHGGYITKAYGQRLNVLEDIVGQPRRDMGDDDYRAWIDVGIRLNIGSGTPEDVLAIISILCGKKPNVLMHEYGHDAIFTFLALPKTPLKAFFAIIQSAAPVTTLCHFIRADKVSVFRLDKSPFTEAHLAEFF
jgi:hypothetical protein